MSSTYLHIPISSRNSCPNSSWSKLEVEFIAVVTGINIHWKNWSRDLNSEHVCHSNGGPLFLFEWFRFQLALTSQNVFGGSYPFHFFSYFSRVSYFYQESYSLRMLCHLKPTPQSMLRPGTTSQSLWVGGSKICNMDWMQQRTQDISVLITSSV